MTQIGFMAIDQYGQTYHFSETKHIRKTMLEYFGKKSASKMYVDLKDGRVRHKGYVIGDLWLTVYRVCQFSE